MSSLPCRLIAIVSSVNLGGSVLPFELIRPPKLTPIGAVPRRGSTFGVSLPLTATRTPCFSSTSAEPVAAAIAIRAASAAQSAVSEIAACVLLAFIQLPLPCPASPS